MKKQSEKQSEKQPKKSAKKLSAQAAKEQKGGGFHLSTTRCVASDLLTATRTRGRGL